MPERVRPDSWKSAIRALRSRNYRLFFCGQGISLIGTWMTRVASSWLIYRLTHSAMLLGTASFAGQIPMFFLAPIAGVWVDRWNRHRTLVVTQILSMVQSFALAALALAGIINVPEIIGLMLFQGLINAFDMPSRQSFLIQMVDNRDDLGNAIALNSSMVNGARLAGPAIAGMLIARVGEGYCFFADGCSYIAVIVSLLLMRTAPARPRAARRGVFDELREGWSYIAGSVPIRSILLMGALVSLVGMPYSVLMPIFAAQVLHGGPHTLGFLMTATGIGALISAVSLAVRQHVTGLDKMIPIAAAVFGGGLIAFASSRVLALSLFLLLFTGFGFFQQLSASNTLLQTIVEEEKRGRVMSFYGMSFQGVVPFGSLMAGVLAARFGAPHTLMISGVLCIAGAAIFGRQLPRIRADMKPIYTELGIPAPE